MLRQYYGQEKVETAETETVPIAESKSRGQANKRVVKQENK
jgi:hypothetical protein